MWPDAPVLSFLKCMPYITSSNSSTQELNHHWKMKKLKIKLKDEDKGIISIPSRETEPCTGAAGNLLLRVRTWLCVSAGSLQRSQTKSKGIPVLPQRCPAVLGTGSASTCREFFPLIPLPPASTSSLCSCKGAGKSPAKLEQIAAKKKGDLAKCVNAQVLSWCCKNLKGQVTKHSTKNSVRDASLCDATSYKWKNLTKPK